LEVADTETLDLPAKLRERAGLVASITPYRTPYLRLGPSIVTSPQDVEAAIADIDTVR